MLAPGQYVTLTLTLYPKCKSDVWIIRERYLVGEVWRYDVENVTRQHSPFTTLRRLFERDLQTAPLQLTLFSNSLSEATFNKAGS